MGLIFLYALGIISTKLEIISCVVMIEGVSLIASCSEEETLNACMEKE